MSSTMAAFRIHMPSIYETWALVVMVRSQVSLIHILHLPCMPPPFVATTICQCGRALSSLSVSAMARQRFMYVKIVETVFCSCHSKNSIVYGRYGGLNAAALSLPYPLAATTLRCPDIVTSHTCLFSHDQTPRNSDFLRYRIVA